MWIDRGFSTYYPYQTSKSPGNGLGIQTHGREHIPLLPTHVFFLNDFWFCDNMKSAYYIGRKNGKIGKTHSPGKVVFNNITLCFLLGFGCHQKWALSLHTHHV
jgi:hypothetical protein